MLGISDFGLGIADWVWAQGVIARVRSRRKSRCFMGGRGRRARRRRRRRRRRRCFMGGWVWS
jgi:hypothetical protein